MCHPVIRSPIVYVTQSGEPAVFRAMRQLSPATLDIDIISALIRV
jgi:hypothetical protein